MFLTPEHRDCGLAWGYYAVVTHVSARHQERQDKKKVEGVDANDVRSSLTEPIEQLKDA
jgi:hypothetical protein